MLDIPSNRRFSVDEQVRQNFDKAYNFDLR